ncbi:hypothetical protein BUY41_09160 [Staphylococcus cohnii]|uniref:hypothetical protein n=1 Tax=Staphylococcus TaxID=1279 RepID=UPI000D1D0B33|nr:hypothetical protein [Staphylococcus sp. GDY8P196P]MCQ9293262.1 hypothetical protein [Staphylococcus cohnii]PTF07117.1 hypothetical protein BUY41_09160 [Staphylococcus cohnii]PTF40767.1 hypothetical protein BUY29_07850 [Staphylococcus cohnii]RIM43085.1 hypothetical protein BUY22_12625 [Staphylococcus cohnii]
MATVTEIGKKQFELLSRNITFKAKVKNNQEEMKKGLVAGLLFHPRDPQKAFIHSVFELTDEFYLYNYGGDIFLITNDFKGMIKFNIRKPNVLHKKHFKDGWMIEIDNLNSVQKGHGQLLLNSIIEVSAKTKLDLCLWTETDKNTQYFERHGFESKGKVGQNKENLMIRYIDR